MGSMVSSRGFLFWKPWIYSKNNVRFCKSLFALSCRCLWMKNMGIDIEHLCIFVCTFMGFNLRINIRSIWQSLTMIYWCSSVQLELNTITPSFMSCWGYSLFFKVSPFGLVIVCNAKYDLVHLCFNQLSTLCFC